MYLLFGLTHYSKGISPLSAHRVPFPSLEALKHGHLARVVRVAAAMASGLYRDRARHQKAHQKAHPTPLFPVENRGG